MSVYLRRYLIRNRDAGIFEAWKSIKQLKMKKKKIKETLMFKGRK